MKFRDLKASEIDCRVAIVKNTGCQLLLYKDARCDMKILDEEVGVERWQRKHELINGNLFCNVGINFPDEDGNSHWIWKQDVGTQSNMEKEKGQASDSFKRACFNWGIGRELYTAPYIWVNKIDTQIEKSQTGTKYIVKDKFTVKELEVEDGNISVLKITNKKGKIVYEYGAGRSNVNEDTEKSEFISATLEQIREIDNLVDAYVEKFDNRTATDVWGILKPRYGISGTGDVSTDIADKIIKFLSVLLKEFEKSE